MYNLYEEFNNPPPICRPAPLWVWNDLMSEEQIAFQLGELKSHGFGGAFVHPRPGLITEYLSEEWFDKWRYALETARSLGLKLYIYDENSYPSGFAGGHVSAQLPDCFAEGMSYRIIDIDPAAGSVDSSAFMPAETPIAVFACRENGGAIELLKEITELPVKEWASAAEKLFIVEHVKANTTGWLGGLAFTDLLRPEVHEAFIRSTHEEYFKRFGADFGDVIPAIFTDEPNISAGNVYSSGSPALPFSYWFLNEFEKMNGYSLVKNLPAVFKNVSGAILDKPAEKVRYDYYHTIHELWVKNSIKPTGEWCAAHGISFTGHYLEHQWPHVGSATSPSMQSFYEYHQWPAIDMLLSDYLRDEPAHALALTIREIRSAANQFGKERTLCELYGAGGWDSTFDDYKRMADWVMVNGINFINQHLTYATIAGARKRDHPQSFDWREPWWDEYTRMNDYISRVCYILSSGKMEQRILLLNPSTTGYLVPYEEEKGDIFSGGGTDEIKNPDMTSFLTISQLLTDRQWDYDYGDEYTIERHGKASGGKASVGKQDYSVIIISGDMKNMRSGTVAFLRQAAGCGVKVIAVCEPGDYVDGEHKPEVYAELVRYCESAALDDIDSKLAGALSRRISSDAVFPTGFDHMRRALDGGREAWFFVNHSMGSFSGNITVKGDKACAWDLFSGEKTGVEYKTDGAYVTFPLTLERNRSAMIIIGESAELIKKAPAEHEIPLVLQSISFCSPNTYPIEYCDIDTGMTRYSDIYTLRAGDRLFTERGFQNNPWDNKVQFRNSIMDRNTFGEGSGFRCEYRFRVKNGFEPAMIEAAAEQYTLCRLEINGVPVEWKKGEHFLDEHFGIADISGKVHAGENVLTLIADRFDVRLEVEAMYLRGDFDIKDIDGVWTLSEPTAAGYGPWRKQGKPFYSGAAVYSYSVTLDKKPETALLGAENGGATAISAIVNGNEYLLNADGHRPADISRDLKAGKNSIDIRVCGSLKNLLGPHFAEGKPRGSAWPAMWKQAPVHSPEACEYDLLDIGLDSAPRLFIS